MYVWTSLQKTRIAPCQSIRAAQTCLVRSLCDERNGCWGRGICVGWIAGPVSPDFMGARLPFTKGIWTSLFTGDRGEAPHYTRNRQPPVRCTLGDGRRLALQDACVCHWRGLGRSQSVEFYRNQAVGLTIRSGRYALLVAAPRRQRRLKCSTRTLAYFIPGLGGQSRRPTSAWRTPMEGRAVSIQKCPGWHMGGAV
ncbi:MAG: hypothetical protein ACI84R_000463 [Candidatus Azotimanducaceae bacterium]